MTMYMIQKPKRDSFLQSSRAETTLSQGELKDG